MIDFIKFLICVCYIISTTLIKPYIWISEKYKDHQVRKMYKDTCMCGEAFDDHNECSGHSPVSIADYCKRTKI